MCTAVGNETFKCLFPFFFFFCWNQCVLLCLFFLKNLLNLFYEQKSSNQIQAPLPSDTSVSFRAPGEPARPLRICILTSVHSAGTVCLNVLRILGVDLATE